MFLLFLFSSWLLTVLFFQSMDVPVDLSRAFFIYTGMSSFVNGDSLTYLTKLANNLETIPAPLLDRMVLEISGYVSEEKAVIASRYHGPQAKDASRLAESDIQLELTAVDILIKYYCRESGVRNLKKHIEKVGLCRCECGLLNHFFWIDLSQGCA